MDGPQFLCIGQQKAGTRWLYDQLDNCDEFRCTPIKELNFWANDFLKKANVKRIKAAAKGLGLNGQPLSEDARLFFDKLTTMRGGQPNTVEEYRSLFSPNGGEDGRVIGDISPGYSQIRGRKISEIDRKLPGVKVVLLVRHPVDRIMSALNMHIRKNKTDERVTTDPEFALRIVKRSHNQLRSRPTEMLASWKPVFGERMQYWFFDDIRERPDEVRKEIASFVGVEQPNFRIEASYNKKKDRVKMVFEPSVREALAEHFAEEVRNCAEMLGGPAVGWVETGTKVS